VSWPTPPGERPPVERASPFKVSSFEVRETLVEPKARGLRARGLRAVLGHRACPPTLYALTWAMTLLVGGPVYAVAIMLILTAHEAGHWVQARRYGVPASLPYFIPFPSIFGTMGAVIMMRAQRADRRQIFDIAISGPLAGLVPALAATAIGISQSQYQPRSELPTAGLEFGEPLVFRWLSELILGPAPEGHVLMVSALGWAGWVGLFITALNLIPVGQLDGGHLLYALIGQRAHRVAQVLMAAWLVAIVVLGLWSWSLFWLLIFFLRIRHPPTADDSVPLGLGRVVLGWATLLFFIVGFTPEPFIFPDELP
jgi:membrane-associated protease RseP (regulator of RpoE activity)